MVDNIWLRVTKAAVTSFQKVITQAPIKTFTPTKNNVDSFNKINLNKTRKDKSFNKYYNEKIIKLFNDLYIKDVEYFNYRLDNK